MRKLPTARRAADRITRIALAGALALVGGCASSARINQFKEFAALGHRHQQAVGDVVDEAAALDIDANSQELLNSRELSVISKRWPAGQDPVENLDKANKAVIGTTQQFFAIKRHASLLDEYFQKLGALASYDSEPIAASAENTVAAIAQLSPKLERLSADGMTLPEAAGALAPVIVNGVKGRLLERELRRNADVINRELDLQQRALDFMAGLMARDQNILVERRILDRLALPYADLTRPGVPADWLGGRRELLLAQAGGAEPAAEAAKLSRQLRQAYLQLLEGQLGPEDVASLASDLSRLLSLVDVVTRRPAGDAK